MNQKVLSATCNKLAKNYKVGLVVSPTSPLEGPSRRFSLKIFKRIGVDKLSAFLKSIETSEESNIVLVKSCNSLSFILPFTLKDTEGTYGTVGDSYLLNYDCNASVTKRNGTFTGSCQTKENIGDKQVTDIVELYGIVQRR